METRRLTQGEMIMDLTRLIGLGEAQRGVYGELEKSGELTGFLANAYRLHQEELELLIKYQGLIS